MCCCTSVPDDVPFSLTCSECDAGMEVESYPEAVALGWTDIDYDPDYFFANFIGLCPECTRLEEMGIEFGEGEEPPLE